jgi:hypothetical protein
MAGQRPQRRALTAHDLHLGLFRHLQGVVDLNPEVSHRAFQVRMSASVVIAGLALVVSILSLVISKRSFERSGEVYEQGRRDAAAQRKRELLVLMSDCRSSLNSTRVNIGALTAIFDAEPQAVQVLLVNYVGLFDGYLPSVERALESLDVDRKAVADWAGAISLADLEHQYARIYDDLKTFQFVDAQASSLIATFNEKLALARAFRKSPEP